jgi:carbon starvation protein CstA
LNLALLGGVFSLIRVVQDAIQSFWSSIMILKEDSIRNNDWVYPIYIFIYMMGANFIPVAILLQRNTPIKTTQKYEESSAAIYDMQDS